jgi:modulator of FtsH protease
MVQKKAMYQQRYPSATTAATAPALLGQVLGISGIGFLVTALAVYLFKDSVTGMASLIAMLVGFGLLFAINGTRANPGLSLILFYAFAFCEGIGIAPVIATYLHLDGAGVVYDAATATGGGMLILGAIAFTWSVDWRRFQGLAFGALLVLVIVGLASAFFHFLHPSVYAWGTLAVFTLLTLVDFSRIRAGGDMLSPVQIAVQIYLDGINIFLAFLQIFGNRNRD